MKFDELLEAPQGFGSTLGRAARAINPFSLSDRSQAQGQFGTGTSANKIYGEYYKWLGSTGQQPDTDNVLSFLKQKGYGQQAIAAAQTNFPQEAEPETQNEPTLDPETPAAPAPEAPAGKLTPDQIAAAKQKAKSGIARTQNNPSGYKNSRVGTPVQRLSGADAKGNPQFRTVREGRLYEGQPLNKDQLSAIFTAVAQAGVTPSKQAGNTAPAGGASTANTPANAATPAPKGNTYGNNTTPNVGTSSQPAPSNTPASNNTTPNVGTASQPAPSNTPSAPSAPATSGNDPHPIVQQYIGLDGEGRQAIRQALDQADKTHPPETTDDRIRENVGYSRFLGMQL